LRGAHRVHTLHVHLDELRETVLVEVQNEVVHEIEAVANDDEWELISQLGFLQEVLDFLGIVVVGLPTDALNFTNLTSPRCGLDVLEVDLRVIAKVYNRTEIVI